MDFVSLAMLQFSFFGVLIYQDLTILQVFKIVPLRPLRMDRELVGRRGWPATTCTVLTYLLWRLDLRLVDRQMIMSLTRTRQRTTNLDRASLFKCLTLSSRADDDTFSFFIVIEIVRGRHRNFFLLFSTCPWLAMSPGRWDKQTLP